jgi:hypothetical protein
MIGPATKDRVVRVSAGAQGKIARHSVDGRDEHGRDERCNDDEWTA